MRYPMIALAVLLVSVALAQPRAWRDINFGDPLLDVADKLVQYDDVFDGHMPLPRRLESTSTTPELILRYASPTTTIGGHRYTLRFSFYDGRLYRLAFVGESYDASFFDTHVADSHRTLVQIISTAHGEPTSTINVGFLDLRNGFVSWTHKWATNTDGAAYDVGLARQGFAYYAVLASEWTWLRELHDAAVGHDPEREIEEAADDF